MTAQNFYGLYDALSENVKSDSYITSICNGPVWAAAESSQGIGIAAYVSGSGIAPMYSSLEGLSLREAAKAIRSWNLEEAGQALAAANLFFNTPARREALHAVDAYENHYSVGIDFTGKTVGVIGHMKGPASMQSAAEIYTLERSPQPGDYPDSACDVILPQCDIVIITGSSITNKTLPHLLELCRDSYTILTGPSVPMLPALLDFGIDRLAGFVPTDRPGLLSRIRSGRQGNPFIFGVPFTITR